MSGFSSKAFILGLEGGLAALAVGVGVGLVWRRAWARPAPIGGLLLVGAAAFGLSRVPELIAPVARDLSPLASLPPGLLAGLVALVTGGLAAELLPWSRAVGAIAAVVGAWIIATRAGLPDVMWIRAAIVVAIPVGGALLAEFDRRWSETSLVLVAVTTAGVYVAVPETTQAAVLLASAVPIVLLAWPRSIASLGAPGAFATAGLIAWTVTAGGLGRPASIPAGLACLGLLAAEPLARALDPRHASVLEVVPARWRPILAVVGQLLLVFVCSRVASRAPSVSGAAFEALVALGASVLLSAGAVRAARRMGRRSERELAVPRG